MVVGRRKPMGNAVLLAPPDISIAVQVSVKYVRKVNGIPSSSNGTRYHHLAYTTWGYLAVSFTRIHRRSINSKQLLDIRALCHTTFSIFISPSPSLTLLSTASIFSSCVSLCYCIRIACHLNY